MGEPSPHAQAHSSEQAAESFTIALRRAQAEYMEMPGLQLTEAQAARLWSFHSELCSAVLTALVESKFLVRTRKEYFTRP